MNKTIYIKTFGCAHNMADSEVMAHYLHLADYKVTGLEQEVHEQNLSYQEKSLGLELLFPRDLLALLNALQ